MGLAEIGSLVLTDEGGKSEDGGGGGRWTEMMVVTETLIAEEFFDSAGPGGVFDLPCKYLGR